MKSDPETDQWIPLGRPFLTGSELTNIAAVLDSGHLDGDGRFTTRCHELQAFHLFYILLPSKRERDGMIDYLRERAVIEAVTQFYQ